MMFRIHFLPRVFFNSDAVEPCCVQRTSPSHPTPNRQSTSQTISTSRPPTILNVGQGPLISPLTCYIEFIVKLFKDPLKSHSQYCIQENRQQGVNSKKEWVTVLSISRTVVPTVSNVQEHDGRYRRSSRDQEPTRQAANRRTMTQKEPPMAPSRPAGDSILPWRKTSAGETLQVVGSTTTKRDANTSQSSHGDSPPTLQEEKHLPVETPPVFGPRTCREASKMGHTSQVETDASEGSHLEDQVTPPGGRTFVRR